MSDARPRPFLLTILDGWGYREAPEGNAILAADTPNWDRLWSSCAHGLIHTSGEQVGLPEGQMGNSEVGHLNLGAGRIIYQESTRISKAIEDGTFFDNPVMAAAVDAAAAAGGAVHIMGLLSPGGVHSHEDHIHALVRMAAARGAQQVCVHAFLDGRDTPPRSAAASLARLAALYGELGVGRTVTLCGRYFAMDRDQRWDRVQRAWSAIVDGHGEHAAEDAAAGLVAAYERDESDEFVAPTVIGEPCPIADGDAVMFMNFRADRARQLSRAFTEPDFDGFLRARVPALAGFTCLTEYAEDIRADVAFAPTRPRATLGEVIAQQGLNQLRIAETEKYAHVTFFFNGGDETPFIGETRELIPSPRVTTYDLKPEMSAPEVTDRLVAAIEDGAYDLIICNYANADMVGHTGDQAATARAVEVLDTCLGRVEAAVLAAGGEMLVTADHGNAEMMADPATGQPHTAHTTGPVPLVYVGREAQIREGGRLCDIAPTVLSLMGLRQPEEMTGEPLVRLSGS